MAGDGKAEDDASAPPAAGSGGPALSLQGASAPPREKPLIEGEAIKAETREPQTKRAEIQKLAVGTSKNHPKTRRRTLPARRLTRRPLRLLARLRRPRAPKMPNPPQWRAPLRPRR